MPLQLRCLFVAVWGHNTASDGRPNSCPPTAAAAAAAARPPAFRCSCPLSLQCGDCGKYLKATADYTISAGDQARAQGQQNGRSLLPGARIAKHGRPGQF